MYSIDNNYFYKSTYQEIFSYMNTDVEHVTCPLILWKANKSIASLANTYLNPQATSVTSKIVFSAANNILTDAKILYLMIQLKFKVND